MALLNIIKILSNLKKNRNKLYCEYKQIMQFMIINLIYF